jgi:hypothetical protein
VKTSDCILIFEKWLFLAIVSQHPPPPKRTMKDEWEMVRKKIMLGSSSIANHGG